MHEVYAYNSVYIAIYFKLIDVWLEIYFISTTFSLSSYFTLYVIDVMF